MGQRDQRREAEGWELVYAKKTGNTEESGDRRLEIP